MTYLHSYASGSGRIALSSKYGTVPPSVAVCWCYESQRKHVIAVTLRVGTVAITTIKIEECTKDKCELAMASFILMCMGYSSRRPQKVLVLLVKTRNWRSRWEDAYQNWAAEALKHKDLLEIVISFMTVTPHPWFVTTNLWYLTLHSTLFPELLLTFHSTYFPFGTPGSFLRN